MSSHLRRPITRYLDVRHAPQGKWGKRAVTAIADLVSIGVCITPILAITPFEHK